MSDKNGNRVPDLEEIGIKPLKGDGDFRSEECIDLLKQADIVVTNTPFSLFREYISQLVDYDKKFLVIGNLNAITYKEIFPLLKTNKIWLGTARVNHFLQPDEILKSISACWFTNLSNKNRNEPLILYKKYNPSDYPKYDNYDAIEVGIVNDIPDDYDGAIGVPPTFFEKYNPNQFEILGITKTWYGGTIKVYSPQTQVSIDREISMVTKLNDGPALKVLNPPKNKTYYKVDNDLFIQLYARVLIKKVQSHEN